MHSLRATEILQHMTYQSLQFFTLDWLQERVSWQNTRTRSRNTVGFKPKAIHKVGFSPSILLL
jgi:hypothetical protein